MVSESELEALRDHVNTLVVEKHERINEIRSMSEQVERAVNDHQLKLDETSSLNQLNLRWRHVSASSPLNHDDNDDENDDGGAKRRHHEANDDELMLESVPIDAASMAHMRLSLERLVVRRNDLIDGIDKLRVDIAHAWRRYDIDGDDELRALVDEMGTGYTAPNYERLLAEMDRCTQLKHERIADMVATLRARIVDAWAVCLFDEKRRREFAAFYSSKTCS